MKFWGKKIGRRGFLGIGFLAGIVTTIAAAVALSPVAHLMTMKANPPCCKQDPSSDTLAVGQALKEAAEQQPIISESSVDYGPSYADAKLTATVTDDTPIPDVAAAHHALLAALGNMPYDSRNAQPWINMTWLVSGHKITLKTEGRNSPDLQTILTSAYAAAEAGAEYTLIDGIQDQDINTITVSWGAVAADSLTATRPGIDQDPNIAALRYEQEARVGDTDVTIRIDPGVARLDDADLPGWIDAAQKNSFSNVSLSADVSGISSIFELAPSNSSRDDLRSNAPALLKILDNCPGPGGTRVGTQPYDAVALDYVCQDGRLQVDGGTGTGSSDSLSGPTPDPDLATELLEQSRQ